MPRKLSVKYGEAPALTITRSALQNEKLAYVALANRKLKYRHGRSRIAYIGSTRKGADRIASSAAWKSKALLGGYGIKQLDIHVVTCGGVPGMETWRKLERALIIRFREKFGQAPKGNESGKNSRWGRERKYFSDTRLDKVIDGLS